MTLITPKRNLLCGGQILMKSFMLYRWLQLLVNRRAMGSFTQFYAPRQKVASEAPIQTPCSVFGDAAAIIEGMLDHFCPVKKKRVDVHPL